MSDKYFLRIRGKILGPFDLKQLQTLRSRGKFGRANDISSNRRDWVPAGDIPELFPEDDRDTLIEDEASTHVATEEADSTALSKTEWHYTQNGQNAGPVPSMMIDQMLRTKQLKASDSVWRDGMESWAPIHTIAEFQPIVAEIAGHRTTTVTSGGQSGGWRTAIIALSLLLLIGGGAGAYFYLGQESNEPPPKIPVQQTTLDKEGYITNVTLGDADQVLTNAVGFVVTAFQTRYKNGKLVDEFIVPEVKIDGFVYSRSVKVNLNGDKDVITYHPVQVDFQRRSDLYWKEGNDYKQLPEGYYDLLKVEDKGYATGFYRLLALGDTGSCFMVTKDGYAITNRHVVEDCHRLQKATNLLREVRDRFEFQDLEPVVYVFLEGHPYEAQIVHESREFDLCIMKIDRTQKAMFRLSNSDEEIPRGETVFSLGYPSAGRTALTDLEETLKMARQIHATTIAQWYQEGDLSYKQTKGSVGRCIYKEGTGKVIDHDSAISPGNSGGPLIDSYGIVFGINTWRGGRDSGTYYAQRMKQLREEIDKHIKGVRWVQHDER